MALADGREIACDAALIGVGALACEDIARDAGLACESGVVVNLHARTSDPAIFAIGDMTRRPMPLYEHRSFRLESVPNAMEQARQAACAIVGRPAPAPETPWFWSDQFDLKLQIAGLPFEADDVILRGSIDGARFAVFHLQGDRLRAVEAVNAPQEFMTGRQLITGGAPVSRAKLADTSLPLKDAAA